MTSLQFTPHATPAAAPTIREHDIRPRIVGRAAHEIEGLAQALGYSGPSPFLADLILSLLAAGATINLPRGVLTIPAGYSTMAEGAVPKPAAASASATPSLPFAPASESDDELARIEAQINAAEQS